MLRVVGSISRFRFVVCSAVVLGLAACSPPEAGKTAGSADASPERAEVVATYGGKEFTAGDFLDLVGELNQRARKALQNDEKRMQFVESRLTQELIYDEGKRRGLQSDPNIRKQIDDLERRLVIQQVMMEHQGSTVSDEQIRKYYDDNPENFSTDRVSASHILVREKPLAEEILTKLQEDPSKFADLAAEHSIDQSNAKRGGDLGYFGRGRMVKEFEDASFALTEDDQLSEIVQTRFGYHIIKRNGREDGAMKEFDDVKSQIRVHLINESRRASTEAFVTDLKEKASLEIDRDVLAGVELPGKDGN